MTLSKSDYLEYRACRHAFWLARHKPYLLPFSAPNDFDLMLMQDGYDVESAVRALVQTWPDPGKLKFQKTYMTNDGLLVRADLIRQINENTIELFEVKSSTSIKGHLEDAAFQVFVIEKSGIAVRKVSIIHVDKIYVRSGPIDEEKVIF